MNTGRVILIIAVCAACTFFERLLPFLVFRRREVPKIVEYIGRALPSAVIATLVVYCLRGVSLASPAGFLPELIAVAVTGALHWWKGNTLLSVLSGTACYMVMVQLIF